MFYLVIVLNLLLQYSRIFSSFSLFSEGRELSMFSKSLMVCHNNTIEMAAQENILLFQSQYCKDIEDLKYPQNNV